jgi:hypothetical protein
MSTLTIGGTAAISDSAAQRSKADVLRIAGLAVLSIRFIQGFIYWGGGSRRFIYAPAKLDPTLRAGWPTSCNRRCQAPCSERTRSSPFCCSIRSALEQWDGMALSRLPISAITNEFAYNRFAPGPFGLRAEMGAMATITLPVASGVDTRGLNSAATLQLRTVNGNTFNVAIRPE